MNADSKLKQKGRKRRFIFRWLLSLFVVGCVFFYIHFVRPGIESIKEANKMADARDLGLTLFNYSEDHDGQYPEGKNSTEVFQKLLDGGYLVNDDGSAKLDLGVLYYPMPGKVKAAAGTKVLKPENICWDVTCCISKDDSEELPLLYLTGYKITYKPGGSAIPLPHPPRTWLEWLHGKQYPDKFIVATYKNNSSKHFKAMPDGTIPDFISIFFSDEGKTYHQLTPDGELPP
jgi:hypothetical protein